MRWSFISPFTLDTGQPVYLAGYVFAREDARDWAKALGRLQMGRGTPARLGQRERGVVPRTVAGRGHLRQIRGKAGRLAPLYPS